MSKPKVAVVVPADSSGNSYRQMEQAGCKVAIADSSWSRGFNATISEYTHLCEGANAIIGARLEGISINGDMLSRFPDLRVYCRYNIGYDDIDISAATELGIIVTNSPVESNWGAVAENTFGFMISLLKNLQARDRHVKEGGWRDDAPDANYFGRRHDGYEGLIVGIIGLGRVGSRLADLLQPWRVRILANDPHVDHSTFVHHNATRTDLEDLLQHSDVVTLHCELNPETRCLIGKRELSVMKSTAIFINAARGALVDQGALFDALDNNYIAAAALDVFDVEPPDKQSPILGLGDKVLLSPHTAGRTRSSIFSTAVPMQTEALLTALRGRVPQNVVNPEVLSKWKERFGDNNLI